MTKILFIPFGIGIAHTGRLSMIARELAKDNHEIIFSSTSDTKEILKKEGFKSFFLPELDRGSLEKAQKLNTNFYSIKNIQKLVKAELDLYDSEKPDLIVSDLRATAKISSKIAGIPHVTVNNANVTKYYDYSLAKFPLPIFSLSRYLPNYIVTQLDKEWVNQKVVSKVGPALVKTFLMEQLIKFNFVMTKNTLKPLKSLYEFYEGDLTLITDAEFYRPLKKLPNNVVCVGPIFWEPNIKLPRSSKKIIKTYKEGKDIIYLTAGGTGSKEIIGNILTLLSDFPATIVVTTANVTKPKMLPKTKNSYIFDYLPGSWIMSLSKVIIFFGGNLTAYHALTNSLPQIVLPLHIDQQDNANQLERLGTGLVIDPSKITKKEIIQKLSLLLYDKSYTKNARKIQKVLKKTNGPKTAAKEINKLLRSKKNVKPKTILNRLDAYRYKKTSIIV